MAESWKDVRRKNDLFSLLQCFDTCASSLGLGGPAWLICKTWNAPIRSQSLSSSWFYSWLCCLVFSSELLAHSFLVPPENEPVSAIKTKPATSGFLTAVLSQEMQVHRIILNHSRNPKWVTRQLCPQHIPHELVCKCVLCLFGVPTPNMLK